MIKGLMALILIISLLSSVLASCNETQIDINTANLTELDRITGIGPVYAQRIIDARPFSSVGDLLRVNGIGNATLNKIKEQGLACVANEEAQNTEEDNSEENETPEQTPDNSSTETPNNPSSIASSKSGNRTSSSNKATTKAITLEMIDLNSKDIKSEDNKEILKKNLALGGIVTFCLLFGGLFFLRFARRKTENEFR